jgi:hypothetical protein
MGKIKDIEEIKFIILMVKIQKINMQKKIFVIQLYILYIKKIN